MKTLFCIKRLHAVHYSQLASIQAALKLQDFRPMKASTIMARLYPLTINPGYGYMLNALGINNALVPNELPLFRLATVEDIIALNRNNALVNFLGAQHLFSSLNAKYATQGDLIMAFNSLHRDLIDQTDSELAKSFAIVQNIAATAYYNCGSGGAAIHRDRIIWARNILKPINCVQIVTQGRFGHPYNDPIGPLETDVLKAVTQISNLINSDMFTMVGSENLSLTKEKNVHGTEVFVNFEFPNRRSYGTFTEIHEFFNSGNISTINAKEKKIMQGFDSDVLVDFKDWYKYSRKLLLAERRAVGTLVNGRVVSRDLDEVLPDVHIDTTYFPLLFAALFDLVEWSWHNDIDAIPTAEDASFNALVESLRMVYSFGRISRETVVSAEQANLIRKWIMVDGRSRSSSSSLDDSEVDRFNNYRDFLESLNELMERRIEGDELPSIACAVDRDIDPNIIITLKLPTSTSTYRMAVLKNPTSSTLDWVTGVLYTLGTWFMIETDFMPDQKMDFPRSSLWDGDKIYENIGFDILGTSRSLISEFRSIAGYVVQTPVCLEDAIRIVRDTHLTTMLLGKLVDINNIYNLLMSADAKDEMKWMVVTDLVELGERVRREVGRMPVAVGNYRDVMVAQRLNALAYAIWYVDAILGFGRTNSITDQLKPLRDVRLQDVIMTMVTKCTGSAYQNRLDRRGAGVPVQ